MRGFVKAGAVLVLALLLSGCIKFDTDITLNSDNTVDGSVVVAIADEFAELPGFDSSQLLDEEPEAPSSGSIDVEPYAEDGFVGTRLVFRGVPIEEFSTGTGQGAEDSLTIVRDGDVFRVSGTFDSTSDTETGEGLTPDEALPEDEIPDGELPEDFPSEFGGLEDFDPSALVGAELRIRVTFPGEVVSANGTIDGNTVTWTPALGEAETLEAVGKATGGSVGPVSLPFEVPWAAWFLGVIPLTFLVGGLVAYLVVRSRSRSAETAPLVTATTAAPVAGTPAEPAAPAPAAPARDGDTAVYPGMGAPAQPAQSAAPAEEQRPNPDSDTTPGPTTILPN